MRLASPWTVAAIVAGFYLILLSPGLVNNPYEFINIGQQYFHKASSSTVIDEHARPLRGSDHAARIGYDGQFYYFLAVDPTHGKDYMDQPGVVYSRIGYPATVRALSGGNATLVPYMMVLVNILAAVGGTLAIAFFLRRHGLPPRLALLYGLFPGLVLSVLRDLTEPLAFGLAAAALLIFDARSKTRLLASGAVFGLAMLTRETVALFPAILALALLVGIGDATDWRLRFRWVNFARSAAFGALAFAPLFIWRQIVVVILPHAATQESFVADKEAVSQGAKGFVLAALVPFHAIARQWPWNGDDVTNLLTVFLPALIWAAIAIVLLVRRKLTLGPLFILANIAVFVVFVPTPIAIDYGSLGRASLGLVVAVFMTLPRVEPPFGLRSQLVRSTFVLWSLPLWVVLGILFHLLGPKYVW